MTNQFMKAQIENMISMVKVFENTCKMAASQDDGSISKEEEKELNKIKKASSRFIADLQKVKEK